MQYRAKTPQGKEMSLLGFGCLRFTRTGKSIDLEKAAREMALAVEKGVTYFDTAYIYPGSESCVGYFLKKTGCREKIVLTTKIPQYLIRTPADLDSYFEAQLERLGTDYVDFYLMHMLADEAQWEKLKACGMEEWLEKKKRQGQIRGVGFSFHGGTESFKKLLDVYSWDICQVQFNYIDEHAQAGIEGIRMAHARHIPVVIMEPLRGGRLARPPKAVRREFAKQGDASPAAWGLRWVMDHEEVAVVLSGMNDTSQVEENVRVARQAEMGAMTDEEKRVIDRARAAFLRKTAVLCTGCGYCMPCPAGVDIPNCFQALNLLASGAIYSGYKSYFMCNAMREKPSLASKCVGCGKCEQKCPQGLPIRQELKKVRRALEGPVLSAAMLIEKKIHGR